jgi:hypothetical protein
MVNEDIVTALKNAIDHGDNLESAKLVMIGSGYNPQEVEEASQVIGGGVITSQQAKPQETLTMPNQKPSLMSRFKFGSKKPIAAPMVKNQQPQQVNQKPMQMNQPPQQLTQPPQTQRLQIQQVSTQQIKQAIAPQTSQQVIQQPQQLNKPLSPQVQPIPQKPLSPKNFQIPLTSSPTQRELKKIAPVKTSHAKEIMLLVLLLVLIGLLITTIVLKDTILGWFS